MSSMETSVQSIDASSALQMLLLLIAAEGGYGPVLTLVASGSNAAARVPLHVM